MPYRAVIHFQFDWRVYAKIAHQGAHIADIGAAKRINALVVVTHGKHRRAVACKQFEPAVLQIVGVLKLVHQNVIETLLVMQTNVRMGLHHLIAAQHQFGKIHQAFLLAQIIVSLITLHLLAHGHIIGRQHAGALAVFFAVVDEVLQGFRCQHFVGDVQPFKQTLNHRQLIATVENLKRTGQARVLVMDAQKAVAQAVKRAQPHRARGIRHHLTQAVLHFFGGFVGKRHRHDAVHTGLLGIQKPRDARGQHTGFATARTSEHQCSRRRPSHGGQLLGIQAFE